MIHVMLPVQYLRQAGVRVTEPQKRLMLAVLQTVVEDCWGSVYRRAAGFGAPTDRRAHEQAKAYVASTDRSWPFSFENVCEAVGLDVGSLRQALQTDGSAVRVEPPGRNGRRGQADRLTRAPVRMMP